MIFIFLLPNNYGILSFAKRDTEGPASARPKTNLVGKNLRSTAPDISNYEYLRCCFSEVGLAASGKPNSFKGTL